MTADCRCGRAAWQSAPEAALGSPPWTRWRHACGTAVVAAGLPSWTRRRDSGAISMDTVLLFAVLESFVKWIFEGPHLFHVPLSQDLEG